MDELLVRVVLRTEEHNVRGLDPYVVGDSRRSSDNFPSKKFGSYCFAELDLGISVYVAYFEQSIKEYVLHSGSLLALTGRRLSIGIPLVF